MRLPTTIVSTGALSAALLCGAFSHAGILAAAPAAEGPAAAPAPPAAESPLTARELDGTLRSVDAASRTLGLLTGVGHAVRLVPISVDRQCQVLRSGAASSLRELKPGDIVHVRVRRTAGRAFAERIEVQGTGGGQ